jgi:hypothetical protein
MLPQAQSEKAVTISEPKGCHFSAYGNPEGSKTPTCPSLYINYIRGCLPIRIFLRARQNGDQMAFLPVFNNMQKKSWHIAKRFGALVHHYVSGPLFVSLSGWFGPNFVTILAPGVRVCSI